MNRRSLEGSGTGGGGGSVGRVPESVHKANKLGITDAEHLFAETWKEDDVNKIMFVIAQLICLALNMSVEEILQPESDPHVAALLEYLPERGELHMKAIQRLRVFQ
eukprot:Blabericola_migrator_1__8733@NODE_45_length_16846_cov_82_345015_g41_i0_p21_GENE_NODE_45_length_16846_cov_82_345015_g41_i0NODE_45_length_16846_cov_82_345015_g41_i0_p21_ORF_typecomplete_len106_score27_42_NODE_45_length_16846_cov_82_345015_g41_i018272144